MEINDSLIPCFVCMCTLEFLKYFIFILQGAYIFFPVGSDLFW